MTKILIALCFLLLPWQAMAAVQVKVYGQHHGSQVIYHYQIINNSPDEVLGITVGYGAIPPGAKDSYSPELVTYPSGWEARESNSLADDVDLSLVPGTSTSPPGWVAELYFVEEIPTIGLIWGVFGTTRETSDRKPAGGVVWQDAVQPGATLGGMSVTLDAADASYINNHVKISRVIRSVVHQTLVVPLEKLDTTPPVLSVSVSPTVLWPPNEKLIPITVTLTVKDDYDPQPEIKLESITANEPLEKDDIKDAQIGTDDRQFKLKAEREGKNMTGRIYTVTYSAIDASGNKTTASATVTVPHDERKKDD
jgi:hypothetical protein